MSFNFMAAVTICSDFGAQQNKVCHRFHCFPIHTTNKRLEGTKGLSKRGKTKDNDQKRNANLPDHMKLFETTHNINNTFGSGTANGCTVQWWFKKFCRGDESLEHEDRSGQPLEVNKEQLRGSSKLILLQLHEKMLKNSTLTIQQLFGI